MHDRSRALLDVNPRSQVAGIKVRDGAESVSNVVTQKTSPSHCATCFDWMDHFPVFAVSEW